MQPVHAEKNESNQAMPEGAPPFVTAGEISFKLGLAVLRGWMYCFHTR